MKKHEDTPEPEHEVVDEHAEHSEAEVSNSDTAETHEAHEAESHEHHTADDTAKEHPFKPLWAWCKHKKKVSLPVAAVVLLAILFAIPFTRYALAGLVWKQDFPVVVIDAETSKPVTRAQVTLKGKSVFTDSTGKAVLHVPVGSGDLVLAKSYYKTATQGVTVPIMKPSVPLQIKLQATGRQVPVKILNSISKQPVKGAVIKAGAAEAQSDSRGDATLVVPASQATVSAKVTAKGYNDANVTVKVTTQSDPGNSFNVTPSGKIYFLSNQSGKIDVVKTNLDGTDRQTVLAGTGKETPEDTSLLASQDWKYLALLSRRDGGDNAKVFLIDTTNSDQLSNIDEGSATFSLTGWDGHRFLYTVSRSNVPDWQPKRQSLKSFDADSKKITNLDDTNAAGTSAYNYVTEDFGQIYIFANGQVAYIKNWRGTYAGVVADKKATLNTINADGTNKKVVQGFGLVPPGTTSNSGIYVNSHPYEANGLYLLYYNGATYVGYKYENGTASEDKTITDQNFYSLAYYTYLVAPSNNQTFWAENRDGKSTFFVGDQNGDHGKQILAGSKYTAYGWYTDDYLLVSNSGSELYIMPASGVDKDDQALKVSDYYRPYVSYSGYGKGYGGY